MVETKNGPFVTAGDAVNKYNSLKGDPVARQPYLMGGVFTDLLAMWRSFELIDENIKHDISRVIPGHEPLGFEGERCP